MTVSQRDLSREPNDSAYIQDPAAHARANVSEGSEASESAGQPVSVTGHDSTSDFASLESLVNRQSAWIKAISGAMDSDSLAHAAADIVSILHTSVRSSRVVLGSVGAHGIQIVGNSENHNLHSTSSESVVLLQAMQEALDHDATIVYPGPAEAREGTSAHERLVKGRENTQVMTLPLVHRDQYVGVVLFELHNQAPWDKAMREFAEHLCLGVAPILALHERASEGLWAHTKRVCQQGLRALLGSSHLTLKCAALTAFVVVAALAIVPVERSVVAEAQISPTMRHIISSPVSGFIESVNVRPGEVVSENQLLLTLDTRDLQLDVQRKQVEIDRFSTEYRGAMADHDRKAMAVAQAKLDRARAESELAQLELSRTEMRAPMAGYVMGDALSKADGAPVERGDALIQIAPITGHEVHLLVDEADIADVRAGSVGEIALKSSPGEPMTFSVDSIRPIAESAEGSTRFRVIASVEQPPESLRPGQTGFAHIATEQRSALRVMTWRISRWVTERMWILFG